MTNAAEQKKLLVVDDDDAAREFASVMLEKAGYLVKTASDGFAALLMCEAEQFDLVICDVRMPRLSGVSFIRNVRTRAPHSAKHIIFLSSLDDTTVKREVFDAGASGYFVKPISSAALISAVSKILAS